jgi:hypothetical protein
MDSPIFSSAGLHTINLNLRPVFLLYDYNNWSILPTVAICIGEYERESKTNTKRIDWQISDRCSLYNIVLALVGLYNMFTVAVWLSGPISFLSMLLCTATTLMLLSYPLYYIKRQERCGRRVSIYINRRKRNISLSLLKNIYIFILSLLFLPSSLSFCTTYTAVVEFRANQYSRPAHSAHTHLCLYTHTRIYEQCVCRWRRAATFTHSTVARSV